MQVIIALIVTPEGFPVAYEVMPGNTSDKTTLPDFLCKIQKQYGKMNRLWIMDRDIPTEEALEQMRTEGASYLVGTPRGRLAKLEKELFAEPWKAVQEQIEVKLARDGEDLYVAHPQRRPTRQGTVHAPPPTQETLETAAPNPQHERREARCIAPAARGGQKRGRQRLAVHRHPDTRKKRNRPPETFPFSLNRKKLRKARRGEGTYLLRTNLTAEKPEELWKQYIVLTEIEQAFKELKNNLAIRPIHHQKDERIEAHIFVSFLSYCLQVTLKQRAKAKVPGLTPRAILEKFRAMQMIDVHLPTTDGRNLIPTRHTQPGKDLQLLLHEFNLTLPSQPPPRIEEPKKKCGADL